MFLHQDKTIKKPNKIKTSRTLPLAIMAACMFLSPMSASAGDKVTNLSGVVRDGTGVPLPGAMVTLRDPSGVAQTVYADEKGNYELSTKLKGKLSLRFRKRYHEDVVFPVGIGEIKLINTDAALPVLTDAKAISDDHPSISHFALIKFDTDENALFSRTNFTRDCLSCHQVGNEFTRGQRTKEGWIPTVQRMHGYLGSAKEELIHQRADLLAKAFVDTALATSKPKVPYDPLLAKAKIYQWSLPDAIVPHDAEFHKSNGHIYIAEMFGGEVIEVDLKTNKVSHFPLPAQGMPPGGWFTKSDLPAPYGLTVSRAPHSLAEGPNGKYYLTDSLGSSITVFNPEDKSFKSHDINKKGTFYPHTVRVDAKGIVWYTIAFSNEIGRFDPKTGEQKVIKLPKTALFGIPETPIPYGIDISPIDASVWYTKLASDKIGHIDPVTLKVTEYDSPVKAPRRHRFDAAGNLWIAGFSSGDIARFDIKTKKSKVYPLPRFAPGEVPAPYALAVHPDTQEVWVNDTMLDVAWRFLPKEERYVAYPMPLKGTYTRDFTFTKEGWACTSNNPIPAAALEGGEPELICIDPEYTPNKSNF